MSKFALRLALLLAAALALGACGEKEQVVVYKQGKYQGKPDNRSWDNESPVAELRGGKWTKGDRTSWEESIKQRQLTQNEYQRINR
jgi:major membrane immunogen (membrane-anchored lipoprotein)